MKKLIFPICKILDSKALPIKVTVKESLHNSILIGINKVSYAWEAKSLRLTMDIYRRIDE